MSIQNAFWAAMLAVLLVLAAKQIRNHVSVLRRFYIPSSLLAGFIGLLLGPQVLGWLIGLFGYEDGYWANGLWPEGVYDAWKGAPGVLINIVFAGLFLGKPIPRFRRIWGHAGPLIMHGQTMAWGQYVIGLLLVVLLLGPVWDIEPMAGALIEIGFQGGHGTAAGLSGTFSSLGFEDGEDLAVGLATVGVVAGVVLGTVVLNWGVARGHIATPGRVEDDLEGDSDKAAGGDAEDDAGKGEVPTRLRDRALESLTFHLGLLAAAIGIGWVVLEALKAIEAAWLVPLGWPELIKHIPLFPLAMLGAVLIQVLAGKAGVAGRIDRGQVERLSGLALDLLIVSAVAALSLSTIGSHIWAFVVLCAAGIGWNFFCLFVFAPRMLGDKWLQYGLADFGQSMGMTVVGLYLIRMSDPQDKTGARDAFGYKQLLFEPVVGGGLFTAASMPLIASVGPVPVLIGVSIIAAGWITAGLLGLGIPKNGAENGGKDPDRHTTAGSR